MGVACLEFRGENFRGWLKNREIHESSYGPSQGSVDYAKHSCVHTIANYSNYDVHFKNSVLLPHLYHLHVRGNHPIVPPIIFFFQFFPPIKGPCSSV